MYKEPAKESFQLHDDLYISDVVSVLTGISTIAECFQRCFVLNSLQFWGH